MNHHHHSSLILLKLEKGGLPQLPAPLAPGSCGAIYSNNNLPFLFLKVDIYKTSYKLKRGTLKWLNNIIFNRPGVAGAVLQSPSSLIH